MKLKFLGTGGGRYVTGEQLRWTGGIQIQSEETKVHLDPGPGALVRRNQELENPSDLDAVVASHGHLDHRNDAEVLIELMTEVGENPGIVAANRTVLEGYGEIEKSVSSYHQELCSKVVQLEDSETEIGDLRLESQTMFHSDPETQGLKFSNDEKTLGIWTDSEFSTDLLDFFSDCDIIVIYCSMPRNSSVPSHTSADEVPEIVSEIEPSTTILTHFGKSFLSSDMQEQENWLNEETESKVIFAEDGMEFPGNRSLGSF